MVFKRDDSWYTYVTYRYTDADGVPRTKRIRKKIGTKKSEAVEAEARIRGEIAAGTYNPDPPRRAESAITFADFVAKEFLPWSEVQHSDSHHSGLKYVLTIRMKPHFGDLQLQEITTKRIEDYKLARRSQSYRGKGWTKAKRTSAATVNREIAALKAVFRQALAWGRVQHSPAAGVSGLRETPQPPRLLEGDEIIRLLVAMPDQLRAAVGCAVYAGLRVREILRLRWADVDLKAGVLTVVSREGGMTKSGKTRKVPIGDDLAELLRQHPRELGAKSVFPGVEGERHDIRTALRFAAKRANLEKVGMHQLRHAFCSHALMAGVDPRTVQGWLGHADLRTTLRYAHVAPDHERESIQRVQYRPADEAQKTG